MLNWSNSKRFAVISLLFVKLIFATLFLSQEAKSEYIFFKVAKDGALEPINDLSLYQDVDRARQVFQFPMGLNPHFASAIADLSESQIALMDSDERLFLETLINSKLQDGQDDAEKIPIIKAVYIPTTLYEMYVIAGGSHFGIPVSSMSQKFAVSFETNSKVRSQDNIGTIWKTYERENMKGILATRPDLSTLSFSAIRYHINKGLAENFLEGKLKTTEALQQKIITGKEIIYGANRFDIDWFKVLALPHGLDRVETKFTIDGELEKFLTEITDSETALFAKGEIPLYRGSKSDQENLTDENFWSLSFGATLFAGFNSREAKSGGGACAWSYIIDPEYFGHRISVPKRLLRDKSIPIFIPPIDVVTGILASGEFFHPRTLIQSCGSEKGMICKGLSADVSLPSVQALLVSPLTKDEIRAELAKYPRVLIKNKGQMPFKLPKQMSENNPIFSSENQKCFLKKKSKYLDNILTLEDDILDLFDSKFDRKINNKHFINN